MADKVVRVKDLKQITSAGDTDAFVIDTESGTRSITLPNIVQNMKNEVSAEVVIELEDYINQVKKELEDIVGVNILEGSS